MAYQVVESIEKHQWLDNDRQPLPPQGLAFGMVLFLVSLGILFTASLIGYLIVRITHIEILPIMSMRPPALLWVSTALILASSVTLHWAVMSIAQAKQSGFRRGLFVTLLLAVAFIAVQIPALAQLLQTHQLRQNEDNLFVFGLVFFLIFVHAFHVIGGLIPLLLITIKARRGGYDQHHYAPVRCIGFYWHFLGGVWVTMFCLFKALG